MEFPQFLIMLENDRTQFLLKLSHYISIIPQEVSRMKFVDIYHEYPMYVHAIIHIHNLSNEIWQARNAEFQILSLFADFKYASLTDPMKYLTPLLQVRVAFVHFVRAYWKIFLPFGPLNRPGHLSQA